MSTRSTVGLRNRIMTLRLAALTAAAVVALALVARPAVVRAADPAGVRMSGRGTAIIDGVKGAGEWDRAARLGYTQAMPQVDGGQAVPASIFVMNDDHNLYLGARLSAIPVCSWNPIFAFDSDRDGDPSGLYSDWVAAHILSGSAGSVEMLDEFVFPEGNVGFDTFTTAGYPPAGTTDGAAAGSHAASGTWAEISHPLDSTDDVHDFSLALGDSIGMLFDGHVLGTSCGGCNGPSCNGSTVIPPDGLIHLTIVPADDTAPRVTSGPTVKGDVRSTVGYGSTRISWRASDGAGTGIDRYQLEERMDGGPWTRYRTTTATQVTLALRFGHAYRFRVRPRDLAGNWGGWATADRIVPKLIQSTSSRVAYPAGRWSTQDTAAALGGATRWSSSARTRARLALTGHAIAWVGATGPTRGRVRVYVDGVYRTTVDLHARSTHWRRVVFSTAWASGGDHSIELRNTRAGRRIDLDAFIVYR